MRRICLFLILLLPFIFFSCDLDGNFGVKNLSCTYLIINHTGASEIKLYCQSEKIGISSLSECDVITDEEIINWANEKTLISENNCFTLFAIPSIRDIYDRNKISIYFEAEVDGEIYIGDLYIKQLQEDGNNIILFKEPVVLESQSKKTLYSIFTYKFYRSI